MRHTLLPALVVLVAACSTQQPRPEPASSQAAHRPPAHVKAATVKAGGITVNLPREQGAWTRPDVPRRITAETIFDYMDGGGELYLGYRFDHLDVFEYTPSDPALGTLLVELYAMKEADEAFGLLSTDWSGEVISFDGATEDSGGPVPAARALYGAGLLRLCAGPIYARILAARETPEAREVVLAIGRGIAASAARNHPPALTRALPAAIDPGLTIRPERTVFLRSHLVLNAAYYLASENILALSLDTEAVTTEYRPSTAGTRPIRVIAARYPSPDRARAALQSFIRGYLPEASPPRTKAPGTWKIEQGWAGWVQEGSIIAVALDAATEALARTVAGETARGLRR